MSYKWCVVPACTNTSIKTPEKLFVCVPKQLKMRKKWLQLARRNPGDIANNSVVFFCEDHFDEFGSAALDFVEDDIQTLKEVHEHMIRSPPPTSCWPHDILSYRTSSAFDFAADSPVYSAYSVHTQDKESVGGRSPRHGARCEEYRNNKTSARPRSSRSASPRSHDPSLCGRPLSLPGESHLRTALSKKTNQQSEKFSLLQHPRPLRRPHSSRRDEDSVQLVQDCDK